MCSLRVLPGAFVFLVLSIPLAEASPRVGGEGQAEATAITRGLNAGYKRGIGLGNYGAAFGVSTTPHLSINLQAFAVPEQGASGFALAPEIQASMFGGYRSSPYVAAGFQYLRLSFGDVVGDGFGGFATIGYEWKWPIGISVQVGAGLHGREDVAGSRGIVSISQSATFGAHWDLGVRYWF